jgi:hypothetical protein
LKKTKRGLKKMENDTPVVEVEAVALLQQDVQTPRARRNLMTEFEMAEREEEEREEEEEEEEYDDDDDDESCSSDSPKRRRRNDDEDI